MGTDFTSRFIHEGPVLKAFIDNSNVTREIRDPGVIEPIRDMTCRPVFRARLIERDDL